MDSSPPTARPTTRSWPSSRPCFLAASLLVAACGGATRSPILFADPAPVPRFPADRKAKILAKLPEIETTFAQIYAATGAPGMAGGLVIDGELVWVKGFGVRDLESRSPVDADTVFRIASMSKSFTAVAILQLRDAGKLRLDDEVASWIPEVAGLRYPTRDSRPITLRDLLQHTGGFPEDNATGDLKLASTEAELLARLKKTGLASSPGSAFEYANLGYEILGLVVERASGQPYSRYVDAHIFKPLGMTSSFFQHADVPAARRTEGYGRRSPSAPLTREVQLGLGTGAPMGGLLTSSRDLARWIAWQLAAWPPRDEPDRGPLARASLREAQQSARLLGVGREAPVPGPIDVGAEGYAFGLGSNQDCELGWVVTHSGGLPGFGSYMIWLPERGVGLFAMTNRTYVSGARATWMVLRKLERDGLLPRRTSPASPALTRARPRIDALLGNFDDAAITAAFDPLLVSHLGLLELRRRLEGVRTRHGACRAEGEIEPTNALRGDWKLSCERGGEVRVHVELTGEERLQALDFREKVPPGEAALAAARLVVKALDSGDAAILETVAHPVFDRPRAKVMVERWKAAGCVLGVSKGGDGEERVDFDLTCGEDKRRMTVLLAGGKLADFGVGRTGIGCH
jgi:CubicO group peptidase (beta-lactamase class C family)